MNREEIGLLSPPELGARAAERVMGYTSVRFNEKSENWLGDAPGDDSQGGSFQLPQFHAFIEPAWKVLMHVAGKKHWNFRIDSQEGYDSGPLYFVEIRHGKKVWQADSRYGDMEDSLPVAICRAALMAVLEAS